MSNYTSGNLINISASEVPAGTLAMKVGNDVFIAGGVNITSTYNVTSTYNITSNFIEQIGDAYVVVDDNGTLKAQKLAFDSTTASDSGEPETLENVMIFNTGHDEPEYEGGNSIDFYKCNSVDSTNQTWTGYKAIFNSTTEIYSFQETTTSGLTYSVITPQVGKVYTDGALIEAVLYTGIPTSGLDFYLPLDVNMTDMVNNLTVDTSYGENYFTLASDSTGGFLRCNKQNGGSARIFWPDSANLFAYGTDDLTVSFWLRAPDWVVNGNQIVFSKKGNDGTTGLVINSFPNGDYLVARLAYNNDLGALDASNANWVNWCFVRTGGIGYWYRNGISSASGTLNGSFTSNEPITIGYHGAGGWTCVANFDLKAMRIYHRALTVQEVGMLAAEFTHSAT